MKYGLSYGPPVENASAGTFSLIAVMQRSAGSTTGWATLKTEDSIKGCCRSDLVEFERLLPFQKWLARAYELNLWPIESRSRLTPSETFDDVITGVKGESIKALKRVGSSHSINATVISQLSQFKLKLFSLYMLCTQPFLLFEHHYEFQSLSPPSLARANPFGAQRGLWFCWGAWCVQTYMDCFPGRSKIARRGSDGQPSRSALSRLLGPLCRNYQVLLLHRRDDFTRREKDDRGIVEFPR